jgi:SAM-dependent methyltransferase
MKGRDSGMPAEDYWNSFFNADCVIEKLFGPNGCQGNVVEFGSGYGTFTLPAAKRATGVVSAFDIEPDLVAALRQKAHVLAQSNIDVIVRDFVADGTGLAPASQAHAMIYNLLHLETPLALLAEAHRVLTRGGTLSIIHWRRDIPTPRGPSLDIRPSPQECKTWITAAGFDFVEDVDLSRCCPYHFGMTATRP